MLTQEVKDLVYKQYLQQEDNKKLVGEFYRCLNEHDWKNMESLFHDEFFDPVPEFINKDLNELKNYSRQFISTFFDENHEKLSQLGKELGMSYVWPPTNKKEMLDIMKLEADFEQAKMEVFYICADGDIVWVTRSYQLQEAVSGLTSAEIVHDRFLIKDGKIRQTESFHDYLAVLSRMGRFLYKQNDSEKIENYLGNLRKLGILGNDS